MYWRGVKRRRADDTSSKEQHNARNAGDNASNARNAGDSTATRVDVI